MICACPFCFAAVEKRGDYCPSCVDVGCMEVFEPRAAWTYEWPLVAEVLFRARRTLNRTWVVVLKFLRWLCAYDQCCRCQRWRPRRDMDQYEYLDSIVELCVACHEGFDHARVQAKLRAMACEHLREQP